MEKIFSVALILVSTFLIVAILMQSRGVGLSSTFGGEGNTFRTKRGAEKVVGITTVVLAVLFALLALLIPVLPRLQALMGA